MTRASRRQIAAIRAVRLANEVDEGESGEACVALTNNVAAGAAGRAWNTSAVSVASEHRGTGSHALTVVVKVACLAANAAASGGVDALRAVSSTGRTSIVGGRTSVVSGWASILAGAIHKQQHRREVVALNAKAATAVEGVVGAVRTVPLAGVVEGGMLAELANGNAPAVAEVELRRGTVDAAEA